MKAGADGRRARPIGLAAVLALTGAVLLAGYALRHPCVAGDWSDGRQYRRLCYTDVVPLFTTEGMDRGRIPYLDPCPAGARCDEYPVLMMLVMRLAAVPGRSYAGFFLANAVVLAGAALATAALLYRMVGRRALYFALAPTLLIYAFVNWDLLAVALGTAGTYAFLRRRAASAGTLLGLGTAAKLFPALLVAPFALDRLRARRAAAAAIIAASALGAWAVVNAPFALLAPERWATVFRFNATRPVDWDSLWLLACRRIEDSTACPWSAGMVNRLSLVAFLVLAAVAWLARRARDPGFPRWTLGLPLLVAFLLASKVYSPQFGLWLLPWFALALPNPWLAAAFGVADAAVFVTRFSWFGRLAAEAGEPGFEGYAGAPLGAFEAALAARAVVLVAVLVWWALARGVPDSDVAVTGERERGDAGPESGGGRPWRRAESTERAGP